MSDGYINVLRYSDYTIVKRVAGKTTVGAGATVSAFTLEANKMYRVYCKESGNNAVRYFGGLVTQSSTGAAASVRFAVYESNNLVLTNPNNDFEVFITNNAGTSRDIEWSYYEELTDS